MAPGVPPLVSTGLNVAPAAVGAGESVGIGASMVGLAVAIVEGPTGSGTDSDGDAEPHPAIASAISTINEIRSRPRTSDIEARAEPPEVATAERTSLVRSQPATPFGPCSRGDDQ